MLPPDKTYLIFELMAIHAKIELPLHSRRSLALVSHEMAYIIRPQLFYTVSVEIGAYAPSESAEEQFRPNTLESALLLRGGWPHATHIRNLSIYTREYDGQNAGGQHPLIRAATIIHACKRVCSLRIHVEKHLYPGSFVSPGTLPIIQAIASSPSIRALWCSDVIAGCTPEAVEEASIGLHNLSLTLGDLGHQKMPTFPHALLSGAAPTLRHLYLTPGVHASTQTEVISLLDNAVCPALVTLILVGWEQTHSFDCLIAHHPHLEELVLSYSEIPDLSPLLALITIDVQGYCTEIASRLSCLPNPTKLRKLLIETRPEPSRNLLPLFDALESFTLLEELRIFFYPEGPNYDGPVDIFSMLKTLPVLRTVDIRGFRSLHPTLSPAPQFLGANLFPKSLEDWAVHIRPRLVALVFDLTRRILTLEHIHWTPFIHTIPMRRAQVGKPLTPSLYQNIHTDFKIIRQAGGEVQRVAGGFRRMWPDCSPSESEAGDDVVFPTSLLEYAVPWRDEDMNLSIESLTT